MSSDGAAAPDAMDDPDSAVKEMEDTPLDAAVAKDDKSGQEDRIAEQPDNDTEHVSTHDSAVENSLDDKDSEPRVNEESERPSEKVENVVQAAEDAQEDSGKERVSTDEEEECSVQPDADDKKECPPEDGVKNSLQPDAEDDNDKQQPSDNGVETSLQPDAEDDNECPSEDGVETSLQPDAQPNEEKQHPSEQEADGTVQPDKETDQGNDSEPPSEDGAESAKEAEPFEHKFSAGDHVIRWEMLPIVYPIQIHGIVLETAPDYVQIADFGLTASPKGDENDDEEQEEVLRSADSKSRLNVITIRDAKVIKKWSKVNYGENIFSKAAKGSTWWRRSSPKGDDSGKGEDAQSNSDTIEVLETASEDIAEEDEGSERKDAPSPCEAPVDEELADETLERKNPPSLTLETPIEGKENGEALQTTDTSSPDTELSTSDSRQDDEVGDTEKVVCSTDEQSSIPTPDSDDAAQPSSLDIDTLEEDAASKIIGEFVAEGSKVKQPPPLKSSKKKGWWRSSSRKSSSGTLAASEGEQEEEEEESYLGIPTARSGWWRGTSRNGGYESMPVTVVAEEPEDKTPAIPLSDRPMNPAMSSLLASSSKRDSTNRQSETKQPAQKLPKADPPKLVLARARFLLEHGESVLPPYHVFYSNSECIAVWCMTGRWSTLQAAVFLHSTAIGNAKSATMISLGIAATQPWLIPALAGVGIAAVGMPWLILKRSKVRWEKATRRLTYLFWAQAEPEVFVECIEKWSGLVKEEAKENPS